MIDIIIYIQVLFGVLCLLFGYLVFPFIPMFFIHFLYRKWIKNLDNKGVRILFIILMLALGILGLFYLVYVLLHNLDAFTDAFATARF